MRSAIVLAAVIIAISFNGVPEGGGASGVVIFFFAFLILDMVEWLKQKFEM